MEKLDLDMLRENGCVAILRADSTEHFPATTRTLVDCGVHLMEFSLTTPGALAAVRELAGTLPGRVQLGVGTVTTVAQAEAAADAGARFLVTPVTNVQVIEYARRVSLPILAGALTPTEVFTAWTAGATAVKVFPAGLGGPAYIRSLSDPFPDIPLVPTGGVGLSEAPAYLAAGAAAVGMGGPLLGSAPKGGSLTELAERVEKLRSACSAAKSE
ncbi:bifunctional 4-hydroxy-2-oxoglutarate aldolase/2-dehydro-3-deoxy-phosphogluconate aldolase [Actinomadura sp. J1-007]|nr:bifunctional 4-hydroxy-2-oxoglutarate aldolase/2-dehydro-3-deoxy-phosphogluconate aldolase [Actinomadura sp. J1-007]